MKRQHHKVVTLTSVYCSSPLPKNSRSRLLFPFSHLLAPNVEQAITQAVLRSSIPTVSGVLHDNCPICTQLVVSSHCRIMCVAFFSVPCMGHSLLTPPPRTILHLSYHCYYSIHQSCVMKNDFLRFSVVLHDT